ncbi:MAG: DUF4445 domain-containing protein [Flexilinea sp.]|nr:DUF4445 domain-containing protein [Flexilinea sp.]
MAELKVICGSTQTVIRTEPGGRVSDILRAHGFEIISPCGGRGVCGKCAVMLNGQVSPPGPAEQKAGVRLACQAVLQGDAEVILPREQVMEGIELGSGSLPSVDPMDGPYGAAIDIGTTTIALNLYDLKTGECLSLRGMPNPQRSVAADVMSRIGAAMAGRAGLLQEQVTGAVNTLLAQACSLAGINNSLVRSAVCTGNTTMLYLLTGRDPAALSRAPFEADHLFDETLTLCGRTTYLPPCMHAFVGADTTCAVLSSGLCGAKGTALLCDVGTNGEIALWKDGEMLVTSTAAGPAFEGAGISCGCGSIRGAIDSVSLKDGKLDVHVIGEEKAVGICGSGLIDAIAAGLEIGIVDETGCMEEDFWELSPAVRLLPGDVRAVQLAKAAIAAGIETLLEEADVRAGDIDVFYIAGGFGSHLRTESAAAIGLFPEDLTSRAITLGNAALSGAAQLLLDLGAQKRAREIAGLARHINLGGNPRFNNNYMERMMFP